MSESRIGERSPFFSLDNDEISQVGTIWAGRDVLIAWLQPSLCGYANMGAKWLEAAWEGLNRKMLPQ